MTKHTLKSLGVHSTRFLKYVWPFFNIIHRRVESLICQVHSVNFKIEKLMKFFMAIKSYNNNLLSSRCYVRLDETFMNYLKRLANLGKGTTIECSGMRLKSSYLGGRILDRCWFSTSWGVTVFQ